MKPAGILVLWPALDLLPSPPAVVPTDDARSVAYPRDYRQWTHVKTLLVTPAHPQFAKIGGFQHIYANSAAMHGYRTRDFPEGSVIVLDWIELRDDRVAYNEGARRQVDVMVKDAQRFGESEGWGFQRFAGDSSPDDDPRLAPAQCLACHRQRRVDGLVLSRYRP